jgi:hypothetical protein
LTINEALDVAAPPDPPAPGVPATNPLPPTPPDPPVPPVDSAAAPGEGLDTSTAVWAIAVAFPPAPPAPPFPPVPELPVPPFPPAPPTPPKARARFPVSVLLAFATAMPPSPPAPPGVPCTSAAPGTPGMPSTPMTWMLAADTGITGAVKTKTARNICVATAHRFDAFAVLKDCSLSEPPVESRTRCRNDCQYSSGAALAAPVFTYSSGRRLPMAVAPLGRVIR